jgi:hypothetical protein
MAPDKSRQDDDWVDGISWEDEKRRKRLGNRKKDSRPSNDDGGPKRGRKRMSRSFSDRVEAEEPRRGWRDSYDYDDDMDSNDDIDLADLDDDFESETDEDSETDDLEDSERDY